MSVTSLLFREEWEGDLLNVSVLGCKKEREVLHSKFTAISYLEKGRFLCDRENGEVCSITRWNCEPCIVNQGRANFFS